MIIESQNSDKWVAYHGDCVDALKGSLDESAGLCVTSFPFSSLYTYSASPRDIGNCTGDDEFFRHIGFMVGEMYRVMKPGRLVCLHCMLLPSSKAMHGYIGLRDFRGDLIREFQRAGFIFHSEVVLWKDPVTAMTRTKALGLLWKQLRKDSAMSRQGIPDYVVVMRKPGVNPDPIEHTEKEWPVEMWQRYASPVWVTTRGVDDEGFAICKGDDDGTDNGSIEMSDTLQKESARDEKDERHIAPLQKGVIRRCIKLWSKPNDVILDPFGGIGSTGHVAIEMGRRALLCELKESYYRQLVANLRAAEASAAQPDLFAGLA